MPTTRSANRKPQAAKGESRTKAATSSSPGMRKREGKQSSQTQSAGRTTRSSQARQATPKRKSEEPFALQESASEKGTQDQLHDSENTGRRTRSSGRCSEADDGHEQAQDHQPTQATNCATIEQSRTPNSSTAPRKKNRSSDNVSETPANEHDEEERPSSRASNSTTKTRTLSKRKTRSSSTASDTSIGRKSETLKREVGNVPSRTRRKPTRSEAQKEEHHESKKLKPSVDLTVHRLRHLKFKPPHVQCIRSTTVKGQGLVAVSRGNGNVELRSLRQRLRTIATVYGTSSRPVNALAWTSCHKGQCQLVGAADSSVFVVNWSGSSFQSVTPSGGGEVCCLETLIEPELRGRKGKSATSRCCYILAAGCQDGVVRFFETDQSSDKPMASVSSIPSAGAAILSLAWVDYSSNKLDGLSGTTVYVGVADGTIRRYDCVNGGWRSTLRVTVECQGRDDPTKVWALKALADGTVVSGDSLGHVQFWDGHTGTMVSTCDHNNVKADVLDLDVSSDGRKVFASGVESRVVSIERSAADGNPTWVLSQSYRPHTHDVLAVSICKTSKKSAKEILITGGLDTTLCTYNVRDFHKRRPQVHFPWPALPTIATADEARLLCHTRDDCVEFHNLASDMVDRTQLNVPRLVPESQTHIGTIEVKNLTNFSASAFSPDGRVFVVCAGTEVVLFTATFTTAEGVKRVNPERTSFNWPSSSPVVSACFASTDLLMLASARGEVYRVEFNLVSPSQNPSEPVLVLSVDKPASSFLPVPLERLLVSVDGMWVVVVHNCLDYGVIQVFQKDRSSNYEHWWTIPDITAPCSSACIVHDEGKARLAIAGWNFLPHLFDLENRSVSGWKATDPAGLVGAFTSLRDYPVYLSENPGNPSQLFMSSFGTMVVLDTSLAFPTSYVVFPERHIRGMKRSRASSTVSDTEGTDTDNQTSCTACVRYNNILHAGFIAANELVVVEQPWRDIVQQMPDAIERRIYGT